MDALKAQFERISQQLAALTATQKMLVAALVAVMVLTMLYWGRYAGNAEMVSVLGEQTLTEDDIGPIVSQLEQANIPYRVDAGKVMVPTERKSEILATLMYQHALPSDTHSAFEEMSKTLNPFTGSTEREATYTQATAMELSELISRFPGVSYAHVVINEKNITRIEGGIPPSATVIVNTRGEPENVKRLVRACADGVAHAVSGLTPGQISVIVNGASIKVPDSGNDGLDVSNDLADLRKTREAELEQKIRSVFPFIDGLTVSVNCDVENRETKMSTTAFDKKTSGVLPKQVDSKTEESSTSAPGSHEPGVSSNVGSNGSVSLDSGGSASGSPPNTSNTEDDKTTNEVFPGQTVTDVHTPAGKDTVQSATVQVPLSYFTATYKIKHPKAAEPSEADLNTYQTTELAAIRASVKNVIGLKSEDDLSVDTYADIHPDLAMAAGPSSAATLTTVSSHAREIGVAVLAVVSLLMMAMMVRKAAPPPLLVGSVSSSSPGSAAATAAEARLAALGTGESVAGEVSAGEAALDGMEMDENAVRTQQMLEQVSTMVKENPDGAAALVKRWLSRV